MMDATGRMRPDSKSAITQWILLVPSTSLSTLREVDPRWATSGTAALAANEAPNGLGENSPSATNDESLQTAKRFASRETSTANSRPRLTINYTP